MDDDISRQAAIQTALEFIVEYLGGAFDEDLQKKLMERMNALPSAQPERTRGKWEKGVGENGVTTSLFCSECNYENTRWYDWNYCPNCGADMRGEQL